MPDEPLDIFAIDDPAKAVDLNAMSWAYRLCKAVQAADEVGLFGALLTAPLDAAGLAARLGTDAEATERLAIVLCGAGLLYRYPCGRYRLTATAREAFDPSSPLYFGHGIAHARQVWARWDGIGEYVKTGQRPGGPPSPAFHNDFVGAMHDYAVRGRAQWLAAHVDLAGRTKLLDLGGGPGTYSIALCQRFPELHAVVWDQPATEPILKANVAKFGLADRIGFQSGDWRTDPFGQGYDCALLSNVLHGPGYGCRERLEQTRAAMVSGGVLLVQDFMLDDDRNGPLAAAEFHLHVGAYTVGEMIAVVKAAGFGEVVYRGRGDAANGLVTAVA